MAGSHRKGENVVQLDEWWLNNALKLLPLARHYYYQLAGLIELSYYRINYSSERAES